MTGNKGAKTLGGLLETATRPLQPCFDITCWLESLWSKVRVCKEVVFISLSGIGLMYWASDWMVTSGLPDHALDKTDPLSTSMACPAPLENVSRVLIWCWESPSLLRSTNRLLILVLSSDTFFPTILLCKQCSAGNASTAIFLTGEQWLWVFFFFFTWPQHDSVDTTAKWSSILYKTVKVVTATNPIQLDSWP